MKVKFCQAMECEVQINPRLLMCDRHWEMVPRPLKQQVFLTYRGTQEIDKRPNPEYARAARAAIVAVELAQGCRVPWWVERGWEEAVHG